MDRIQMNTVQLLDHVISQAPKVITASLCLNFGLRSTHKIAWENGRLYDTGCDDIRSKTSLKAFRNRYPEKATWLVAKD